MNRILHLDFETYSELNVVDVGAFKYAQHPSTEVLICCYALDDGDVRCWLPFKSAPHEAMLEALADPRVRLAAHNAQFEFAVYHYALRRVLPRLPVLPPERWYCTALLAASAGLPRSLDGASRTLKLSEKKDSAGGELIRRFSMPRKPTKADSRTRIMPVDDREAFNRFIEYCRQDVRTERAIHHRLPPLELAVEHAYRLDLQMNTRGLPLDMPMVKQAYPVVKELSERITARVEALSGGIRPTQRDKMLTMFKSLGIEIENLQARTVRELLKQRGDELPPQVKELLQLRVEASKASTKKLASMLKCAGDDGRARGMFLMHGAHTGRYAGRLIQPQNFIRGNLERKEVDNVFLLLEHGDADLFEAVYDQPLDVISQCMRGFIAAHPGYVLPVADYTAIEARVLAWVAEDETLLNAYRSGIDVYKLMAARIYGILIERVSAEQRRIGKNLVLGCGYGLGKDGFIRYCATSGIVITEEFSAQAINGYRENSRPIVRLWEKVEKAAQLAVSDGRTIANPVRLGKVSFYTHDIWLCVMLPSGRKIMYPYPRVKPVERFGTPSLQLSFWAGAYRESTYGGKLVENIVQAISYDIMSAGMDNAQTLFAPVVGTVHDEIICETQGNVDIKHMEDLICKMPVWATGIPLNAKGFVCDPRYRKD